MLRIVIAFVVAMTAVPACANDVNVYNFHLTSYPDDGSRIDLNDTVTVSPGRSSIWEKHGEIDARITFSTIPSFDIIKVDIDLKRHLSDTSHHNIALHHSSDWTANPAVPLLPTDTFVIESKNGSNAEYIFRDKLPVLPALQPGSSRFVLTRTK